MFLPHSSCNCDRKLILLQYHNKTFCFANLQTTLTIHEKLFLQYLTFRFLLTYLQYSIITYEHQFLLYFELAISFLIGRKRTVNFRNQRLWRHNCRLYNIHMSRTLKVTGNHVMYDRGAWFLRVIMSSSRAFCCLSSVKKHNMTLIFFSFNV